MDNPVMSVKVYDKKDNFLCTIKDDWYTNWSMKLIKQYIVVKMRDNKHFAAEGNYARLFFFRGYDENKTWRYANPGVHGDCSKIIISPTAASKVVEIQNNYPVIIL